MYTVYIIRTLRKDWTRISRVNKMADGSERIKDNLSSVTDEAKKALANLESLVKGGGAKKKVKKRRVDIFYDSSGTRIIKTPGRASVNTTESSNESTSSTISNGECQWIQMIDFVWV